MGGGGFVLPSYLCQRRSSLNPAGSAPRGAGTAGSEPVSRRVVLVSESAGLAAVLSRLLDRSDRLTRVATPGDLAGRVGPIDLVVLDVPAAGRRATCEQLRRRYAGPLIVLVDAGDEGRGLPADKGRTLLTRPFAAADLAAALRAAGAAGPAPAARAAVTPIGIAARRPEPTAAAPPRKAAAAADAQDAQDAQDAGDGEGSDGDDAQAARQGAWFTTVADEVRASGEAWKRAARIGPTMAAWATAGARRLPVPERATVLFGRLLHGLRTQRRLRLAAFGGLAVVAFLVAFAVAAQNRCGPGCASLGPSLTQPTVSSGASVLGDSTGSNPTASTVRGTGTTRGAGRTGGVVGGVVGTTTSTTRPPTTTTPRTTRTTRPPTTRPPTTVPPTTVPPTTVPPTTL
jgi:hypothetical protein